MKTEYSITIKGTLKTKAGVDAKKIADAIFTEWSLDCVGISNSDRLPLGKKDGYKPVKYGPFTISVKEIK